MSYRDTIRSQIKGHLDEALERQRDAAENWRVATADAEEIIKTMEDLGMEVPDHQQSFPFPVGGRATPGLEVHDTADLEIHSGVHPPQ